MTPVVVASRQPDPTPIADAIRRAGGKLKAQRASASMTFDGPTPERLVQAGDDATFGSAVRSIEIVQGGETRVEQIRTPRTRVDQDPFTRLVQRGELDPTSEDLNRWLGEAGMRYRRLHETAGRSEIQAQDFTKGFTTASRGPSEVLDRMLDNWSHWDKARQAISPHMRRVLDDIVLHGIKPEDVGAGMSAYTNRKYRTVAAMTALRLGLLALDEHFAAVDRAGAVPA